ncbi:hypothetical protein A0H81_04570 [Grifola frondosa]|uniref:Secreted protein n=1 Tax=Grifola frondosa TaxID=5627 RepID=A0A1C7MFT1_GRIFR|nr:hypothetical protein A0H81_04570 [Grifola frondosa]
MGNVLLLLVFCERPGHARIQCVVNFRCQHRPRQHYGRRAANEKFPTGLIPHDVIGDRENYSERIGSSAGAFRETVYGSGNKEETLK